MGYAVNILADSVGRHGKRLTTFELTYPRFVHAEFMTHRQFSRNAASSRAIPIETTIDRVMTDPALPVYWGKNQKGMVAEEELSPLDQCRAQDTWLEARTAAVKKAWRMLDLGVHKQIVNRLLEPWVWITVICSTTEYENFFSLRCAPDAQPEIRHLACMMRDRYYTAQPQLLEVFDWHLPLVSEQDRIDCGHVISRLRQLSVARCARVSYLTHDGTRDLDLDFALHDRLLASGHMSPFEHPAQALPWEHSRRGNFLGWEQYRQGISGECRRYSPPDSSLPADNL